MRGNLTSLSRYGKRTDGSFGQIDDLTYHPVSGSNRIDHINDAGGTGYEAGFDNQSSGINYGYDAVGNVTTDPANDLQIEYNHLNLPYRFTKGNGTIVEITYTASGQKLRETTTPAGGSPRMRTYLSDMEYTDGTFAFASHAHGRVIGNPCEQELYVTGQLDGTNEYLANKIRSDANIQSGSTVYEAQSEITLEPNFDVAQGAIFTADVSPCAGSAAWQYEFFLRDHLGNNRIVFADKNGNNSIETDEILQENHYYAFGMAMEGDWTVASAFEQRYRYNGKELNEDLNLYDYGARWYDPAVARWTSVDPLADMYTAWSPYNYVMGNPISFIDPDGRSVTSTHTDKDGNVVAVYQDGDNGVYKHDNLPGEFATTDSDSGEKLNSSDGELMGETLYWDEFVDTYSGEVMEMNIDFGSSWDEMIDYYHGRSKDMSLSQIAQQSKNGGLFSIQDKPGLKRQARLLNGYYASSRSAGNYLAGLNAGGATQFGFGMTFDGFQKLAGALHARNHSGEKLSKFEMALVASQSDFYYYGSHPTYGELPYQYRMSIRGWKASGNKFMGGASWSRGHGVPPRTY